MKVKVSYTVDLEEVPEKIGEIVAECKELLRDCYRAKLSVHSSQEILESEIGKVQEVMDMVAAKLNDVIGLNRGLQSVINPSPQDEEFGLGEIEDDESEDF